MQASDVAFTGSIPEIYDRCLGPMLFEPYARDLARRFAGFEGALLETAAGTGRVTRALAEAAPKARITATDLNEAMLAKAATLVRAPNVEWRTADAQALPFADAAFDALVCQFGVMFFPDKAAAYAEAHRVLRPGGRFVFNVWDGLAHNAVTEAVHQALAGLFPDDPPGFLPRVPFGYHDEGRIREQLAAAGFGAVEVERVKVETRSPSADEAATGLCLGTPVSAELAARGPDAGDRGVAAAAAALRSRFGDGEITGPGQALVVTARA